MQPPLQDPSFSLSSPHFKEGQWRSKGPAWPFRVTTRIGWEPSSPEGAPRCPQPWPAPSAPLLLGGPTLVTLDGCSPSSPHGTSPDRSSQEPEEHRQPSEHPGTGNPACSSWHQAEASQILASRGISSPSTPGRKLLYHPLLALIPSKHSWPMAPSPRGASASGTHTVLVPAPLPGKPSRNLLSADTKQQCPAAPPLTGD